MTTFIKKKLKDREGNYLVTPSSADIVYCSDGETVATKLRKVENDEFSPTITQMSGVSKVGVGEDIDISDNTQEGYLKSAILKGQTLVNIAPNMTQSSLTSGTHPWKFSGSGMVVGSASDNKLKISTTIDGSMIVSGEVPNTMKPSTKYYVQVEVKNNSDHNLYFYKVSTQSINLTTGLNKFIITTVGDFNVNHMGIAMGNTGSVKSGTEFEFSNLMIIEYQEGMENWDIPYFEGMQSVRMPVLTTTGKNLFDLSKAQLGYITSDGNINPNGINNFYSDYISIKPNTDYTFFKVGGHQSTLTFTYYDKNKNFISFNSTMNRSTSPSNAKFLIVHTQWVGSGAVDFNDVKLMIVEGQVKPTTYEPYKSNILTTAGKNLFNMNRPYDAITDSQATVVQDTDQITVSSAESGAYVSANFILNKDFFAGKTVTGSCLYESDEKDIGTVQITYQDGNGEHHYQWIKTPRTFTFPNSFIGDVMLSVTANNTNTPQSNTVTVKNIQLELGSTATSYEPYSEVELCGIDDVQDELNLITGELTENVKKMTLNGSENWTLSGTYSNYIELVGIGKLQHSTVGFCDKLPTVKIGSSSENNPVGFTMVNHDGVRLKPLEGNDNSLEDYKQWLKENPVTIYFLPQQKSIKTVDLTPGGTNPTTKPYVWKDGHIQLSSEEGSLLPTLDYSVTTSRGGQILENTKHIAKQDKRIYDLEMLMISSSVEDAYQRLLLQNDVQVMSRMDETHLNPMRYYMLTRLIEEKMYEETDILNKLDTFFLYGDISSDQYFELMDKIFNLEEEIYEDEEHSEEK